MLEKEDLGGFGPEVSDISQHFRCSKSPVSLTVSHRRKIIETPHQDTSPHNPQHIVCLKDSGVDR